MGRVKWFGGFPNPRGFGDSGFALPDANWYYIDSMESTFYCLFLAGGTDALWPERHCLRSSTAKHPPMFPQASVLYPCCTSHQDCSLFHLPFILLTVIYHSGKLLHILQNPIHRPFLAGHFSWHLVTHPHPSIPGSVRRATVSSHNSRYFLSHNMHCAVL